MKKLVAFVLATFILSACGGGGGSSNVPGSTAKTQSKSVTGSVVISIPTSASQSSAKVRYPQFVSPNASSVELSVNGGADTNFDVSSTSSLCVTASNVRNCTLSFGAPVGSDTFAFLIFTGANGTGTQLASASTTQTISAGTAFNFTVALNAAIGTIIPTVNLNGNQGNCPNGNANFNGINEGCGGSVQVTFTIEDPSGATITGTAPFAAPINITTSDPSVSVTPAQITAPGQGATLSYSGAAFAAGVTNIVNVTMTAGGYTSSLAVPVDRSYLYVANSNAPAGTPPAGGGNIAVYQFGSTGPPVRTLTGGLSNPVVPILDANDKLWVLDNGPYFAGNSHPYINIYAAGATGNATPISQITTLVGVDSNTSCEAMAFNPAQTELFVSCDDDQIHVFPTNFFGSATASSLQTVSLDDDGWSGPPVGMAFDNSGNLYVANPLSNSIGQYVVATLPTSGANQSIFGAHYMSGGFASWPASVSPLILLVDNAGTLYSSIAYYNSVAGGPDANNQLAIWNTTAIPCTNCAPSASLTGGVFSTHAPEGIMFDAVGNFYISNPFANTITEYARATMTSATLNTNNPTVLRTINTGASPNAPAGMTIGP